MHRLKRFCERLLSVPYTPWLLILPPALVGGARALEEAVIGAGRADFCAVLNGVFFYAVMEVCFASLLGALLSCNPRKTLGVVAPSLLAGLLPPLIDVVMPGAHGGYHYYTTFKWNFIAPYQPLGEVIVVWSMIACTGVFVAIVRRSLARALLAWAGAWIIMQLTGWCMVAPPAKLVGLVNHGLLAFNFSAFLIIAVSLAVWNRESLGPSLRRLPHALPWTFLGALGARAAGKGLAETLAKATLLLLAGGTLVVMNDWVDREQDGSAGGKARPVTRDDVVLMAWLQILAVLGVIEALPGAMAPLFVCVTAMSAYHAPGLRWKRFPLATALIEGLCVACAFLFGVAGQTYPFSRRLTAMSALILVGGAVISTFKDFKDLDQDRAAGVRTTYAWLLDHGMGPGGAHLALTSAATLCLAIPPLWLWTRPDAVVLALLASLVCAAAFPAALWSFRARRTRATAYALFALAFYLGALTIAVPQVF